MANTCETCWWWERNPDLKWCGWCHKPGGEMLTVVVEHESLTEERKIPRLQTGALSACKEHKSYDH